MNILSLFAGIGGLELGLERAGLGTTRWQVELEPFNRKVLAAHWPDAERFADVRDVSAEDFPGCDVICGGFPCQDISSAGKGEGIDGQRSGLWREFARLIGEIRPRIVVVENVPDLAVRGLGRVLGDLCALGYDAEWEIVSAQDAGAPHLRKRLFILATHTDSAGLEGRHSEELPERAGERAAGESSSSLAKRDPLTWWQAEPAVGAVADGIPGRVAQLRALGNAVVPQVAELVGRRALRILERGAVDDDPWDLRP
ncbi:MAG: DNA cytosine methyltransferase [bacterium]|nr:DNA cytosine methyltransferase [bacterium]